MNHMNTAHEQVSAFADGRLRDEEFAQLVSKVCEDDELRGIWQTYHLVGDVLRSGAHSACSDTSAFLSRFQQRLAAEPAMPAMLEVQQSAAPRRIDAANEPVFRWKLVAGAASMAAVAAIGWSLAGGGAFRPASADMAQVQNPAPAVAVASVPQQARPALASTRVQIGNGNPQVMLRDPRLDQLLEAHQQASGASGMPSGFLRNATFEGQSR